MFKSAGSPTANANNSNKIIFIIPSNLELEKLLLSHKYVIVNRRITENKKRIFKPVQVKTQSLLKHLPYCYYLIDLIIDRSLKNHDNVNGYVNLMSELLDKVIPKKTRIQVISLLEYLKVINVNKESCKGRYSKSYRIDDNYTGTMYKEIIIDISNDSLYNNIYIIKENTSSTRLPYAGSFLKRANKVQLKTKFFKDDKTNNMLGYSEYSYQRDQLLNLKFDYNKAVAYARYQYMNQQFDDDTKKNRKKYHKVLTQLNKIKNGKIDFNLNNSVNRLFSCVTNLRKEYRNFILDNDGSTMLEIDFSNSHIYHLLHLINFDVNNCNYSCTDHEGLIEEIQLIKSFIVNGTEMQSNDLYTHIANRHNKEHSTNYDRSKGKEIVLRRLINGMYPNQHLTKWINHIFPRIAEYIAFNNKERRNKMAIRLMISESKLLHNHIMKEVAKLRCTAFAVHDSIIVESNYFDAVSNIMREESIKYFGFEPNLTAKDLDTTPLEFTKEYASAILMEKIRSIRQEINDKKKKAKLDAYDFWDEFEGVCTSTIV